MENETDVLEPVVETTTETAQPDTKIASAGAPQRAGFVTQTPLKAEAAPAATTEIEETTQAAATTTEQPANAEAAATTTETKTELSDEDLKRIYQERFPITTEPTEEEIKAKAQAEDKQLLDVYIERKGTIEHFAKIKEVAGLDAKELAKTELILNLQKEGHDSEFIEEVLREQFYQINLEDLEQEDDETTEEFETRKAKIAKKVAIGNENLEKRGLRIKKEAEGILNTLKEDVSERALLVKEEAEFSAKVDKLPESLPKSITLELGKLKDKQISVQYNVDDADVSEVIATLKDPVKRKQLLFNEDDTLNEKAIANLLLRNKIIEKAAREAWDKSATEQTKIVESIFPNRNPNAIGVGGSPSPINTDKGKVAGFGQSQRLNGRR